MGALAVVLITAAPVAADAYQVPAPPSPTASCDVISPVAIPCVALGKFADAVAAECRRVGVPDARCVLPLAHRVTQAARDAYLQSWVHRTARFQDALQDPVPLRETQWLGTHNSFNSLSDSFTVSHADSNQQLSLAQQLDIDVRALELDLHYLPRLEGHGAPGVTVCHGLGPKNANLGCTVEPLLATVLPQIANWLNAPGHTEEVILLYLEDQLKNASAYESSGGYPRPSVAACGRNKPYLPSQPGPACHQRLCPASTRRVAGGNPRIRRTSRARRVLCARLVGRRLRLERR